MVGGDRRWSLRHTASDRGGAAGLPQDRNALHPPPLWPSSGKADLLDGQVLPYHPPPFPAPYHLPVMGRATRGGGGR